MQVTLAVQVLSIIILLLLLICLTGSSEWSKNGGFKESCVQVIRPSLQSVGQKVIYR